MKKPISEKQRQQRIAAAAAGRGDSKIRSVRGLPRTPELIHAYYVAIGRAAGISHKARAEARRKAREKAENGE